MYELEPDAVPVPALPGEVVVAADEDEVIDRVAEDLVRHAETCVREFGDFHLVACGGAVPRRLYRRLMYDPQYRPLPWRRTHLWLAHEHAARDDDASVWRQVHDFVGEHADIPPSQMHPILHGRPAAAADYERDLREHLAWREKGQDRPDYVLLELRPDGTIAGLAAGEAPDGTRFVTRIDHGTGGPPAVSMLPTFINAARLVAVIATGRDVAAALPMRTERGDVVVGPIRGIAPAAGELRWYVDRAACRAANAID